MSQAMRKLWTDHVFWTREVIMADLDNLPSLKTALNRLLSNQLAIGNFMASFYGTVVGDTMAGLLTTHIKQAVVVVDAAKTNSPDLAKVVAEWMKNADEIAAALYHINPEFGTLDQLTQMMHTHLNLTIAETQAMLKKDGSDVGVFEEVLKEILMMSDALSQGIGKQLGIMLCL
jgi:hypothetical protein